MGKETGVAFSFFDRRGLGNGPSLVRLGLVTRKTVWPAYFGPVPRA